ncbi:MAG: Arm DNA-binding domain-containing protein [Pasteurellaceae bacterium]|nr:Arm DNA-binding domain-containing protein [Pasteurellaceae bacterium]
MAKLKIKTDTQIKALKKSGGYVNDDRFSVDSVRNLYLFYYAKTERKVFYFRYAHPITKSRLNLLMGEYPSLSLSKAVKLAVDYNEMIKQGIDQKPKLHALNKSNRAKFTILSITLQRAISMVFINRKPRMTTQGRRIGQDWKSIYSRLLVLFTLQKSK